ncbi:Uncharacterized conserved protein, DUF58 family, contains vWF domain [Jatrophihabitans endophyticus]|uniref:Uncharacterized conserved protein, DUF58 family, contains vWF domain n=1 Tax=Jatrophihabitans endophyticus TaxID=1206085 RepID=A0A1M5PP89_9ACTN|nr:DUF58 domain-containing protein [Jatrophihabitans endophyticus]SHH03582.1 Uncharacterized conserved protein, DUF58 family, contains vWF domain [Jatrophihabitans endophyticus]
MTEESAGSGLRLSLRPTARGVLAAVLGAALLVGGGWGRYPGLVAFGAALLLLVVAAVASVLLPAPVLPERRVAPLRVARNAACTATLRVRSGGERFAVSLDALERIGDRQVPVVVPRLRPGAVVEARYDIPTSRRGRIEVGPLRLRRVGVAGLAVAQGVVGSAVTVHVLPRVLPVLGLPAGVRRGHVGADERVERGGTDLVALREYTPGDDLRRVHWATSARSGTLMVREDADPARPHLTVVVDDRADRYAGEQFEDAVEVAASLAATVVEAGHPIRLVSVSGELDVDVPAAPPGMLAPGAELLLRGLAELRATATDGPGSPPLRDLDVVVVVTGARAAPDALVADAARASLGVALVLDAHSTEVSAHGAVLVLRGPRAEDLLQAWDAVVS